MIYNQVYMHEEKGFETRPSMLGVTQQRAFMPVYIEKVEIRSGVTDPWQTTEYSATCLKFKS